jgi:hypothetical protein
MMHICDIYVLLSVCLAHIMHTLQIRTVNAVLLKYFRLHKRHITYLLPLFPCIAASAAPPPTLPLKAVPCTH